MSTQGSVFVDGIEYRAVDKPLKEANKLLNEIYCSLWAEAHYDAYNESSQAFAKPLADKMIELSKLLKFKS